MAEGGYALIHRTLLDHPAFQDEPEAMAFAALVMRAAWRPCRVRYKGCEIVLERGQVAISVRDFAQRWGWSKSKADRFFSKLERELMANRKRDSSGTGRGTGVNVLTICNYDKYQVVSAKGGTPAEPEAGQQRDSSGTQNKEGNTVKKRKTSPTPPSGWPDGQPFPDEYRDWAMGNMGWSKVQAVTEGQRFIDYSLSHGKKYSDWLAAWRNWCRSSFQKTVGLKQAGLTL